MSVTKQSRIGKIFRVNRKTLESRQFKIAGKIKERKNGNMPCNGEQEFHNIVNYFTVVCVALITIVYSVYISILTIPSAAFEILLCSIQIFSLLFFSSSVYYYHIHTRARLHSYGLLCVVFFYSLLTLLRSSHIGIHFSFSLTTLHFTHCATFSLQCMTMISTKTN